MWCRSKTKRRPHVVVVAAALGVMLAGCSDLYLERRDAIALSAGDAVEANKVAQVIDPWPAQSANTKIAFNGQKMQSAVERYRTNLVTAPVDPMMLQVGNPSPAVAQTNISQSAPPTSTTTATTSTSGQ